MATKELAGVLGIVVMLYVGVLLLSSVENSVGIYTSVTVSNATAINGASTTTLDYVLSSATVTKPASLVVAYQNNTGTGTIAVGSTSIGILNGASPQTFSVPGSLLTNGVFEITYTMAAGDNVTDTDLTYQQTSLSESMDTTFSKVQGNTSTSMNLASIYPVVIIAGLMIMAFLGFTQIS